MSAVVGGLVLVMLISVGSMVNMVGTPVTTTKIGGSKNTFSKNVKKINYNPNKRKTKTKRNISIRTNKDVKK